MPNPVAAAAGCDRPRSGRLPDGALCSPDRIHPLHECVALDRSLRQRLQGPFSSSGVGYEYSWLETGSHGFVDQPVHGWATVAADFHRTAGEGAAQRSVGLDLHANVRRQVAAVEAGAADDGAAAHLVFAGDLEADLGPRTHVGELAIGETRFDVGLAVARHQLEDHVALAGVLAVGNHLLGHGAVAGRGQGAGHLLAEQFLDLGRLQLVFVQVALEHVEHAGAEGRQRGALGRHAVGLDQALHGAVTRHGDVHPRRADQAGLGMADEVHAVHRLEDEAEGREANDEDPGAEGHRAQAAQGAHAVAGVLGLARLGEVVALQGGEHVAHGHDVAGQVRGDQLAQGRDVLGLEVLELATDTTALAIHGAHLQLHVHGQPEVVDDELQATLVHIADLDRQLPAVEAQAAGGEVDDPRFDRGPVGAEEAQLGRDFDPGVLALGFGFMHYVDVHGGVHKGDFLVNSGKAGQTIISSAATKMLPAEKVMVRDDQVLNQR
ncbi:hypothetical protein EMIT051CA3_10297 [Pseudomonas chlororaphis]